MAKGEDTHMIAGLPDSAETLLGHRWLQEDVKQLADELYIRRQS